MFKQKQVTKEKNRIHGVRMGAGDRSYLVRDNEISVFKNRFGGVEVSSTRQPIKCIGDALVLQ